MPPPPRPCARVRPGTLALLGLAAVLGCRGEPQRAGLAFAPPPERALETRPVAWDVDHYRIELRLDVEERTLDGTCTVRLFARERIERVVLDLAGLAVRGVTDGDGRALDFEHAGERLDIALAAPLAAGDFVELAVRYGGRPAKGLWFGPSDGAATQVFTQGQCEDARWWFPCRDVPSERATTEVSVRLPASWTSVAAGELVDRRLHGDGTATVRWRAAFPHPSYLVTFAAGDFAVVSDRWDGVPVEYLAAPEHAALLRPSLGETPRVLEVLTELAGRRYPYPKYAQTCVAGFPFGGMENLSASTLTERCLQDARGLRDDPAIDLVVHEAAHQWFGDLLTCADWSHVWLNEGFATYFTQLYFERTRGEDDFRARMAELHESYLEGEREGPRPIVHGLQRDPIDLFGSGHVYPGGASRLHLLRFLLGDDDFFRGMRRWVAEHAGRAVTTDDLQATLERVARRDLSEVFRQWLHSPGVPEIEFWWRWDANRSNAIVVVNQVQPAHGGVPEVFRVPIEVELRDADGARVERLELTERRHLFRLPAAREPDWVRLDPRGWIPMRLTVNRSLEEWLAIAARCDGVLGRRDAVLALGRIAEREEDAERRGRCVEALAERLAGDPSAAVRRAAAAALATPRSAGEDEVLRVRAALGGAARSDADVGVRVRALRGLERAGRDAELVALAEELFDDGASWGVMAAAAALRCTAGPSDAWPWLAERLALESPHGVLRAGLVEVAARVPAPQVPELLLACVRDRREEPAVREAAALGLARRGHGRTAARTALVELLEEPWPRLRRRAIEALDVLQDPAALPALVAYWERTPFPRERRAVEQVLARPWARAAAAP